jgi:Uma2 family endonuclease
MSEEPAGTTSTRERQPVNPAALMRHARMSYEDFLEWADEDTLAEWVDGEVIMASPASLGHQRIVGFLGGVLAQYVAFRDLGVVILPPFQMKMRQGREPDVLFLAKEHLDRLQATYLDGPADLVVEVTSPESAGRDRGDKFYEYASGGVLEYWLIDPIRRWCEFYYLDEGHYDLLFQDGQGRYDAHSVPGFWLDVAWLWQIPSPVVEDVLLDVAGADYANYLLEHLRQRGFLTNE